MKFISLLMKLSWTASAICFSYNSKNINTVVANGMQI